MFMLATICQHETTTGKLWAEKHSERSNIKASTLVHWRALCQAKRYNGQVVADTLSTLQLPAGFETM